MMASEMKMCSSKPEVNVIAVSEEKISPFQASYYGSDPSNYMQVGKRQFYNPEPPHLPDYCKVVLDCAVLFGNSSLAAMYEWDFNQACAFWETETPLTDFQRQSTLLGKRIKVIGIDSRQAAVNYSLRMNIIDEGIVQNFEDELSCPAQAALEEADVWILQQCLSYMPLHRLHSWMKVFLKDRSRPKCFIYDFNPYFDNRDMSPGAVLKEVKGWKVSLEKFYAYRQKTDEEYATSQENGRDMCVHHYVVDFDTIE